MTEFQKRFATPVMVLIFLAILFPVLTKPASAGRLTFQGVSGPPVGFRTQYPSALTPNVPLTVIDGKIGRQPVYTELVSRGVAPSEVLSLARSFKGVFDFRNARPKDEYQVCLTPKKKLQKLIYKTGLTNQYVAVRTDNGAFHTYRQKISLEKETVAKTFTIGSSLYQAVTGQGETGHLVAAFTDIFSWDIDFYLFPRKGDIIRVLYEKYYHKGHFVKYGKILVAQYIGSSETFSAFYFDNGRQAGYYDENGVPLRKMFMRIPVKFGMRTSSFSIRRFHPISKKYKRHTGIDYGAPHGTPIHATAGGTVEFAGRRGGYGKLVVVRHPNGYKTYYGHCSRLLVKKGTHVKQGQAIAKVGRTGQATGPHVHYETRINGKPVNPNSIKTARGNPLPFDQRARFELMLQTRMQMMADRLFPESRHTAAKATKLHQPIPSPSLFSR
jgi:murein DD-endopeptidase MepM/ murein hydrolase activator NlpD